MLGPVGVKGFMLLCVYFELLDFRGHIEGGTSYAMQLADLTDFEVLEGRWINQKSRRMQCQSHYYITLLLKKIF